VGAVTKAVRLARLLYSIDCHLARCWDLIGDPERSGRAWLDVEASSIRLDLAVAEASLERIRGSVAW
jgi:hypothetical protein